MGPGEQVSAVEIDCYRCGRYRVSGDSFRHARDPNNKWAASTIANASGWVRENQGVTIDDEMLSFLSSMRSPSVAAKADKLLSYLARQFPRPGVSIFEDLWTIDAVVKKSRETPEDSYELEPNILRKCRRTLPYLSASWSEDQGELQYVIFKYLKDHKGLLAKGDQDGSFMITPAGWDHVFTQQFTASDNFEAFVAMWFDPGLNAMWTSGIVKGVMAAGYDPVRIDKREHNNKIDDEIVAAIRRARFVVADFTGQRGGVYFEAGLAAGLGKPVVWLCRRADLKEVHFDTRQYNFLLWDPDAVGELASGLQNRIEATIGRGRKRA